MSSFVYLYSLYVHMVKLYLSVFERLLSVFNVNCMHQGSESNAISILCMCCTCGRIDNKADFYIICKVYIYIYFPLPLPNLLSFHIWWLFLRLLRVVIEIFWGRGLAALVISAVVRLKSWRVWARLLCLLEEGVFFSLAGKHEPPSPWQHTAQSVSAHNGRCTVCQVKWQRSAAFLKPEPHRENPSKRLQTWWEVKRLSADAGVGV